MHPCPVANPTQALHLVWLDHNRIPVSGPGQPNPMLTQRLVRLVNNCLVAPTSLQVAQASPHQLTQHSVGLGDDGIPARPDADPPHLHARQFLHPVDIRLSSGRQLPPGACVADVAAPAGQGLILNLGEKGLHGVEMVKWIVSVDDMTKCVGLLRSLHQPGRVSYSTWEKRGCMGRLEIKLDCGH